MASKFFFGIFLLLSMMASIQIHAQYNIFGVGVAHGQFSANELEIKTNVTGFHSILEVPLNTYSLRFGFDYLSRIGAAPTTGKSISSISAFKLMGGKVFNEGGVVQFPLLLGVSILVPNGDIELAEDKKSIWGASVAGGLRVYISNRFAIFGEVVYDGSLLSNYTYTDNLGNEVKSNIFTNNLFGSIGISFVYRKKKT